MRSKNTSRYRAARQEEEQGIFALEETKEEILPLSKSSNVKVVEAAHLLLFEKSELLLPYLDKHDRHKLSRGTAFA